MRSNPTSAQILLGRYGGEEFLTVLTECSPADLAITAERMRLCVSGKPVDTESGPIPVTISIGLVSEHAGSRAFLKGEELLRAADIALYRAKTNGRNRVECGPETGPVSQAHAGAAR